MPTDSVVMRWPSASALSLEEAYGLGRDDAAGLAQKIKTTLARARKQRAATVTIVKKKKAKR